MQAALADAEGRNWWDLLLAGPNEPGGHAGNGYVATYIQSLPGSIGPTERGVEHVAGVYAGSRTVLPLSNNPTDGRCGLPLPWAF